MRWRFLLQLFLFIILFTITESWWSRSSGSSSRSSSGSRSTSRSSRTSVSTTRTTGSTWSRSSRSSWRSSSGSRSTSRSSRTSVSTTRTTGSTVRTTGSNRRTSGWWFRRKSTGTNGKKKGSTRKPKGSTRKNKIAWNGKNKGSNKTTKGWWNGKNKASNTTTKGWWNGKNKASNKTTKGWWNGKNKASNTTTKVWYNGKTNKTEGLSNGANKQNISENQKKIFDNALNHNNSETWGYYKLWRNKTGYNNTFKCNLFVFDVLNETNLTAPNNSGVQLLANQWADPNNEYILKNGCYKTVPKNTRQAGDIIAFKRDNKQSGHVCIVSSRTENCIGAGTKSNRVEESSIENIEKTTNGTTVWRYTC